MWTRLQEGQEGRAGRRHFGRLYGKVWRNQAAANASHRVEGLLLPSHLSSIRQQLRPTSSCRTERKTFWRHEGLLSDVHPDVRVAGREPRRRSEMGGQKGLDLEADFLGWTRARACLPLLPESSTATSADVESFQACWPRPQCLSLSASCTRWAACSELTSGV